MGGGSDSKTPLTPLSAEPRFLRWRASGRLPLASPLGGRHFLAMRAVATRPRVESSVQSGVRESKGAQELRLLCGRKHLAPQYSRRTAY
jgi:hypothetical protein